MTAYYSDDEGTFVHGSLAVGGRLAHNPSFK